MTNALGNNQIEVYQRASDGTLSLVQTIATTGGGSGVQLDGTDSLGSEGGLMLDKNHTHLFAVNTETLAAHSASGPTVGDCQEGSITSFLVESNGTLSFVQKTPSGGLFPNSLTVNPFNNLLYVLNAGGPGIEPVCGQSPNITGFTLSSSGMMTPIANSTQPINPGTSPGTFLSCDPGGAPFSTSEFQCGLNPPAFPRSPGQIGFDRLGIVLVVTEKGTNSVYLFPVGWTGKTGAPIVTKAQGPNQPTYFGFAFDFLDRLIIAEPFGATPVIPAAAASAVSSFSIGFNGVLHAISADVANRESTTCWIVLAGQYVYATNNGSSNVSLYKLALNGSLTLANAAAASVNRPNDMAVVSDEFGIPKFLYVLESGGGSVGVFDINADGSLTPVQTASGLPVGAGAQGLAAY